MRIAVSAIASTIHCWKMPRGVCGLSLSIVGAGFGRTGTYSLKEALERLGFGPCYHMGEVEAHPEHTPMWHAAVRGESVEWDTLLRDYNSTVDWPAAYFWLELMYEYPESKVILSVRDAQDWYRSMSNTILELLATERDDPDATDSMANDLILNYVFSEGIDDKDYVLDVFQKNTVSVCQTVPAGRLLVFDVCEGWAPLCEFLEVDVPEEPFPRRNNTEEFRVWSKMEPKST